DTRVAVSSLRNRFDQPLLDYAQGTTDVAARLIVDGERNRAELSSTLRGIAIDLPPPFSKAAPEALPLQAQWQDGPPQRLHAALGEWVEVDLTGAPSPQLPGSAAVRIGRTGIAQPAPGELLITGHLPPFDLMRWRAPL